MSDHKHHTEDSYLEYNWRLLMGMIYGIFIGILLILGYILLADDIHAFLNQKTYTSEELAAYARRAKIRQIDADFDKIENGIHLRTGLHNDPSLQIIIASCTSCHSAKLITQNKATRDGWKTMIKWMQATQGLPDLGKNEPAILDYLAKYYAPENIGRRKNIDVEAIEWFVLNQQNSE